MKHLFFALLMYTPTSFVTAQGDYILVIEGMDWGAAATKVILPIGDAPISKDGKDYIVSVKKNTECTELSIEESTGELKVLYAYTSDAKGQRLDTGDHVSLVLYAAPYERLGSPIQYFFQNQKCDGNVWLDFKLTILDKSGHRIWNNEIDRIIPLVDDFDVSGTFSHNNIDLTYASFSPRLGTGKRPLLIWLHGGGEGGTDPTIPLIANRAANYASTDIQTYFNGAYVLVPQTPTFWMDSGNKTYTFGDKNDLYNEALMALIENYVDSNPMIDPKRIYLGGCSNGGYMTLKLLLKKPGYFAASFPTAVAMHAKYLSNTDIEQLSKIPIWFIHSKDDPVTIASETVVPMYEKIMATGADDVHFSFYDHVIDITNQFGGTGYHYNGHFSWIYAHTNKCQLDYNGSPVMIENKPVSLMAWLANHKKK